MAVALSDEDEIDRLRGGTIRAGRWDFACARPKLRPVEEVKDARNAELILWARKSTKKGRDVFTQEAAHSKRRILHAHGDSTGHEIMRVLIDKVRSTGTVSKIDYAFTRDLIIRDGRCMGAIVCQQALQKVLIISARAVMLATGGAGQLVRTHHQPPRRDR